MWRRFRPRVRRRLVAIPVLILAAVAAVTALAGLAEPPSWLAWCPPWLSVTIAAVFGVLGTWWVGPWTAKREEAATQERGAVEQLRRHLGRQQTLPRMGDPSVRALAMGVHRAIPLADSLLATPVAADASRRVARSWRRLAASDKQGVGLDPELPTYVERDLGGEIGQWMREARNSGGFLVLVGDSSVGKTRLLYEVARKVLSDFYVLAPVPGGGAADGATLVNMLAEATFPLPKPGLIVWLDELQRFLEGPYQGLDSTPINAATIRRLLEAPTPVVLLGSLWPEHAIELRSRIQVTGDYGAINGNEGPSRARYPAAADVLNYWCLKEARLPSFSAAEQRLASIIADKDPRLAEALALTTSRFNVTEVLAGAPQQIIRYDEATIQQRAVLDAAIDAWRVGLRTPLTEKVLDAAARGYLATANPADTWLPPVLASLCQPEGSNAPLIELRDVTGRVVAGYIVADYLLQHGAAARRSQQLPTITWQAFMDHLSDAGDLARLTISAERRLLYCYAEPLYRRFAHDGDRYAAHRLADLLVKRNGPSQEVADAFQVLIDAGAQYTGESYGRRVYTNGETCESIMRRWCEEGHHDAAVAVLRAWADAGDRAAAEEWAKLLIEQDRTDHAAAIARTLVDIGEEHHAAWWFQELLIEQDRTDEALAVLRAMTDAGGAPAACLLEKEVHGQFRSHRARSLFGEEYFVEGWFDRLVHQDRSDEAMTLVRAIADAGGFWFQRDLADMLAEQGNIDELRARADKELAEVQFPDHFDPRLAQLLVEQGNIDELRARADAGSWAAARDLAQLLENQGNIDELTSRANADDEAAGRSLALRLYFQEDAVGLRARADVGDKWAAHTLTDLLVKLGRIDEAVLNQRTLAHTGDSLETKRLASVLLKQGESQEAASVLRAAADAGDKSAGADWAKLLIEQNRIDQATPIVKALAAYIGLHRVFEWIGRLTDQGRTEDALTVLLAIGDAGDPHSRYWAADKIVDTLVALDRTENAIEAMRTLADAGYGRVTDRLAKMLVELGDIERLQDRADAGDIAAAGALAELLAEQGDIEQLRARVEAHSWDWCAAGDLVQLLVEQGRLDELRARADGGHEWAAEKLAELLAEQGHLDELRARADAGDLRSASRLVRLLGKQDSLDDLCEEVNAGTYGADYEFIELLQRVGETDLAEHIQNFGLDPGE